MHNDNGDPNENPSNPAGSPATPGTGVATRTHFKSFGIVKDILKNPGQSPEPGLPTEVRRVRRGRFFLTDYEQTTFGSIRQPIFDVYCHGVVVGETVTDEYRGGIWCFGAHNDFDMVPEFQSPRDWPEYIRTPTGFVRADGARRLEGVEPDLVARCVEFQRKVERLK